MFNFLIAPDFPPQFFSGWHLLNTYLQRQVGTAIHLLTPDSAHDEKEEINNDKVDLIYANPFDAAKLIREMGYLPVVKPINKSDEMVIVSSANSPIKKLDDVKPEMSVLYTENIDVKMVGLRLLEAADIEESDLKWIKVETYQKVARELILNHADIGFFMASAYHSLTKITTNQLHLLIESRINDLSHLLLLHSRQAEKKDVIQNAFINIKETADGKSLLADLGLNDGFDVLLQEEAEFLIDLIETLRD